MMRVRWLCVAVAVAMASTTGAQAEDGYDLWMRYRPLAKEAATALDRDAESVEMRGQSATLRAAADELRRGLAGLTGHAFAMGPSPHPILLATSADGDVAASACR